MLNSPISPIDGILTGTKTTSQRTGAFPSEYLVSYPEHEWEFIPFLKILENTLGTAE